MIAKPGMKLGVNNDVNRESHKASLKLMAGGPSKINPPNSHPSNPIHKQATEAQGLVVKKKPTTTQTPATNTQTLATTTQTPATDTSPKTNNGPRRSASCKQGTCGCGCACFGRPGCLGENIMSLSPPLLDESFDQEGHHSISSQVFLPRKETTCPAVLKMKLTVVPMRPGRMEAYFLPIFLRLFPTVFVALFKTFIALRAKEPTTKPATITSA